MRNLGLIGCVGGIPTGVFQDITLNDGWRYRVVITGPDKRAVDRVEAGKLPQALYHLLFALCTRKVHGFSPYSRRHRGVDEGIEAIVAYSPSHFGLLLLRRANMTPDKIAAVFEVKQGRTTHRCSESCQNQKVAVAHSANWPF